MAEVEIRTRGHVHLIDINAPVKDVWHALVDEKWLTRWYSDTAEIDARENGYYRLGFEKEGDGEARIDVFDKPKRLRLIYLSLGSLPSDATLICDFLLDDNDESKTTVHLFQTGIPRLKIWDEYFRVARVMWDRRLVKLRKILE